MKYLVTGGAGFIGSHLSEHLLDQGHEVFILDDLSTGSIENIIHLKSNPRFHYTIGSIMDIPLCAELVDRCETVVHLAAAVGVRLIIESPVRTIETNIKGTEIVLELAEKKKKKVVLASTSEVYGKSDQIPFSETADLVLGPTTKGRWSYACSKAIDEFLSLAYWHEKKVPVVVVRLFNTVGPRQVGHYGMVLPNFVQRALENKPLAVFGDGEQTRCFCHVKDAVRALALLAESSKAVGEVFNLGADEETSILGLAQEVIRLAGSSSKIEFIPYEKAYEKGFEDMKRRVPDISKIRNAIGYEPAHSLTEIIQSVIGYYRAE